MNEPDAAAVTKTLMPDGNPQPEDCRGDILIVDDDLSALQTLGALLTREGYEVRSAPTGQTALTFAREDPPELVLLDIRLPDMDGFEVCGELKREPQTANIPVIFISALEETGDKIKGFTAGAVDYVTKPFQGGELLARVETHLALIRLRNKVESQNEQLTRAIQESKEAETKVRQAAEEWRTTFDSIRDMVSIHDRDYRILRVNQAFAAALGMDIKQIIGKKCCDVIHGTGCPPSACPHAQAMASGKPVTEEFLEPRLGKYLQVSASPILNDRNEVSGSVHIVKDVTERKRAEDALQKAHDELEERVKERTSDLAIAKEQLQKRLEEIEELKSRLEQENIDLREEIKLQFAHEEIVGESEGIRKILMQVEQVAGTEATVLIQGETGTGKEIFARTIHRLSGRKDKPLITVNCASLPPTLIESELFGREKGAYTGALTRMVGRFEIADGATIFLDEIGEIPPEIQSKLLRIL
ncbi:MAG TPA: sigma 54-interacting transcriptional regulator [Thermodesulfobacteriota bacterium]|nr:sigma 54-interacting transcriptional regulator [Thermodesulfobacteriota bacterium]